MDNTILFYDTAQGTNIELLFEVGNIGRLGFILGLGIVALACILAKCLFLYYIKFHAPKERPLNKLLALEQVSIHFTFQNSNCEWSKFFLVSGFDVACDDTIILHGHGQINYANLFPRKHPDQGLPILCYSFNRSYDFDNQLRIQHGSLQIV